MSARRQPGRAGKSRSKTNTRTLTSVLLVVASLSLCLPPGCRSDDEGARPPGDIEPQDDRLPDRDGADDPALDDGPEPLDLTPDPTPDADPRDGTDLPQDLVDLSDDSPGDGDDDAAVDIFDCDLGIESSGGIVDYGQAQDYLVEFASPQEGIWVNIARIYVTWGVGESKIFDLGGLALVRDELLHCITDPDQLAYENSHHNWRDVAYATEGETRYVLEMTYVIFPDPPQEPWEYKLTARRVSDDLVLWGPIYLDLLSGPRWP